MDVHRQLAICALLLLCICLTLQGPRTLQARVLSGCMVARRMALLCGLTPQALLCGPYLSGPFMPQARVLRGCLRPRRQALLCMGV